MEMTREQFIEEIIPMIEECARFNVESVDSGSVFLSLYGCVIDINKDDGISGELIMYKPDTLMEVDVDFAIIDTITKEDDSYHLAFNNGMADVVISVVA